LHTLLSLALARALVPLFCQWSRADLSWADRLKRQL